MWRAFFLAVGITLAIVGVECLVIERATLTDRAVATRNASYAADPYDPYGRPALDARGKDVVPPEWAPWSLMSAGAVVILYSFTIPRRVSH